MTIQPCPTARIDSIPAQPARSGGRREDDRLLTGQGRFVDDHAPPGCLHMAVVRSDAAGVALVAVDVAECRAAPGVHLVLTGADLAGLGRPSVNPVVEGLAVHPFRALAVGRVDAVGQPVAVVVAETPEVAADAAELIEVAYGNPAPAETDAAFRLTWSHGTAPAAAAQTIRLDIACARVSPAPLEPRAALADPTATDGKLTVWVASQSAHRVRDDLSAILGLAPETLRVIAPDVGGAFGGKASLYPEDALVAEAARRLGRPVKWRGSRQADLIGGTHGRGARLQATARLAADGTVAGLSADLRFPLGAWMPFSAAVPARNCARILPGPYRIPHLSVVAAGEMTATAPLGIYRGAGRPEAALLMERLMDMAARRAGVDPIAYRRRHLIPAAAFPYATPSGETLDSGDFAGLLDRLEAHVDYPALTARIAERRAAGAVVGLGVALYIEPCGHGWESARASLTRQGRIRIASGSSAQGQGRETAYAAIAAQALGVSSDQIDVVHSDTDRAPAGIGALASRGTPIGGSAVLRAARALRQRLRERAAPLLGCGGEDVVLSAAGVAAAGGGALAWDTLAHCLAKQKGIGGDPGPDELLRETVIHHADGEAWASGVVLAQLAIDRDTGVPTVERLVWVEDAGRILDPVMADGQLIGGLAQGLGEALLERIVYEPDGQILTGSLMDYALPRASDMPPVDLLHQETPTNANPLGAKGVGEAGCIGVPAAIVNAAVDALSPFGVAHLDMPLTSEKLWRALSAAPQAQE